MFNHTNSGESVLENLINRWLNEKLHHDRRSLTLEVFLEAVQLLCLIIVQTLGLLGMYWTGMTDDTQWSYPLEG